MPSSQTSTWQIPPLPVQAFSDVAAGFSPVAALQHCDNYKDRNCSAGISSFKTSYFHFLAPQASPCAFPRKVGCHSPPKKSRTSSFKTSAIVRSCRKSPTILFAWAFFALALMCRRSCLPWRPFGLFLRSMR